MKKEMKLVAIIAALCLSIACLAACGGSGSSGSSDSNKQAEETSAPAEAAPAAETSEPAEAAAPAEPAAEPAAQNAGFVGSWMIAAAETQGVTMGGNFGDMFGETTGSMGMTIEEGGTGSMAYGEDAIPLTWTQQSDDTIIITVENTGEDGAVNITETPVTLKDGALFMKMETDEMTGTLIFTADGNYADARQITLEGATPVTSEDQLLGTWNLVGVNMAGVSMYGAPEDLSAMMGGTDMSMTFEEGGVVKMSEAEATWAITDEGAVLTTAGLSGDMECPLLLIGDELAVDYSGIYGGEIEFIMLMAKA